MARAGRGQPLSTQFIPSALGIETGQEAQVPALVRLVQTVAPSVQPSVSPPVFVYPARALADPVPQSVAAPVLGVSVVVYEPSVGRAVGAPLLTLTRAVSAPTVRPSVSPGVIAQAIAVITPASVDRGALQVQPLPLGNLVSAVPPVLNRAVARRLMLVGSVSTPDRVEHPVDPLVPVLVHDGVRPRWGDLGDYTAPRVVATSTNTLGISDVTDTAVTWAAAMVAVDTLYPGATTLDDANDRFTIPTGAAGFYVVLVGIDFAASTAGTYRRMWLTLNTTRVAQSQVSSPIGNVTQYLNASWAGALADGDDLAVEVRQDSGGSLNVTGRRISIVRLSF